MSEIKNSVVQVDACYPHPRNYNQHPAAQVERLAQSLHLFGQVRSIVVQEAVEGSGRYVIVAGEGVWQGAKKAGMVELKADVIPSTWPEHMVLAYLAADNELSRGSDPDREQLALLVAEVGAIDDRLGELAAGSEAEVLALQKLLEEQGHAPEPMIDQADALREQWGVEAGQLWTIQSKSRPGIVHRLLCGDATDPLAAARLLGDRRPALMVTDPPYGVELDHSWRTIALDNKESERGGQLMNDDRADWSEIYPFYGAPVVYAWHASRFTDVVKAGLEAQGYQVRQMIIWVKKSAALSRSAYHWQHEPCWYAVLRERLGPRRAVSALLSPQRAVYQDGHRAAWCGA